LYGLAAGEEVSDMSAAQQGSVRANVNAIAPTPTPALPKRPSHHLWAVLIVRIYEVFPQLCPASAELGRCGASGTGL
jgi:hypothetical protein